MSNARSRIELKISCKNLPRPSSNQVIISVKDSHTGRWVLTSNRTEVMDSPNPVFVNSMIVDYRFEEVQLLRFVCMSEDEEIGHYDCSLGSIFSPENKKKIKGKLSSGSGGNAFITISAEEVVDLENIVTLQIKSHNIAVSEQAFLTLSRSNEDGTYSPVYNQNISSEGSTLKIEIGESTLCNSDKDREFKIKVKSDERELLGECAVTLDELLDGNNPKWFPLNIPHGENSKNSKLEIKASLKKKSTFLDYIVGGVPINLVVAIDFTESNGDPKDQKSLHYVEDKNENDYQRAIRSVGTILEQYDSDKKIPLYGFGAKFNGVISHAFPLNGNLDNPEVRGINGVMEKYKETINSVKLSGPTNFSPVIKQATQMIESEITINKNVYYILLIVTDGIISDMNTTIRSIVKAKDFPLSIVIVGVGDADFTNMKILDADDKPLKMQHGQLPGVIAGKDIVQFVAMREFKSGRNAAELLAKEVMEEIPNQFMKYMEKDIINGDLLQVD